MYGRTEHAKEYTWGEGKKRERERERERERDYNIFSKYFLYSKISIVT